MALDVIVGILATVGMVFLLLILGLIFMGIARKVSARIHRRIGPPLYQPILDVIKLWSKIDPSSHGLTFDLGPLIALGGAITAALLLPIMGLKLLSFSGDFIVLMYLMELPALGIMLGAAASGNPFSAVGVYRGLILFTGAQLPYALAVMAVAAEYKTLSLTEIVALQQGSILNWGLFRNPFATSVIAIIGLALLDVQPFDIPSAPGEISMGPMVEYGGKHLALMLTAHGLEFVVFATMYSIVFLGGVGDPISFIVKTVFVALLAIFIMNVYPRWRIEQAFSYLWKYPAALALLGLVKAVMLGGAM